MMKSIPPRLRASVIMLVGGAVITGVSVAAYGWSASLGVAIIAVVASAGYYVVAGRDSDFSAMLREQADERQAYRRLRIQALVGRITTLAAGTAFLAAVAAKITLWPFYIFITVPGVTFLAGWLVYRDHPGTGEQQIGH
jgi:hypothetical protein